MQIELYLLLLSAIYTAPHIHRKFAHLMSVAALVGAVCLMGWRLL